MTRCFYRIARHLVQIDVKNCADGIRLLPSFIPFALEKCPEGEHPVLHVTIDDDFKLSSEGKEIGEFDSGGNLHRVGQLSDGSYQFGVFSSDKQLCSEMQCAQDFSTCTIGIRAEKEHLRAFGLNNCIMIAFAFSTIRIGTLLVHASVIRKDGYGYLMTAPSGTGKSTHTFLWYKNIPGCDLMNDDNPVVRIIDGKSIVFGSPWSGKTPCYRNTEVPIGAIVRIQQRPKNSIRPMNPVESMAVMLSQVSSMKWDKNIYHTVCSTLAELIGCTSFYELGCLPNADAAHLCYNTVAKK